MKKEGAEAIEKRAENKAGRRVAAKKPIVNNFYENSVLRYQKQKSPPHSYVYDFYNEAQNLQ